MKIKRGDIVLAVWLVGTLWTIGWKAMLVGIPLMLLGCAWAYLGLRGMGLLDPNKKDRH